MDDENLPRQHVKRPALPWRDDTMTECGRPADDTCLTREQAIAKARRLGPRRAALTTCLVCLDTAQRWPGWDLSPAAVMARELKGFTYWRSDSDTTPRIQDDLRAIALLIDAHREEFNELLAALQATVPLRARKARRGGAS